MRVVSNLEPSILAGIQQSQSAVQTALQQVSTGQRVNVPGDDPAASALLVQNLAASNNNDQYTKNADSALIQAQTADSVLTSVVSLLTSAVSLGVQGATGTNNSSDRKAIAQQVQGLLTSVVSDANKNYQGVAIFAGTEVTGVAFAPDTNSPTGYTYQGNGGTNQVQIGDSLQVAVNISGSNLFTNPSGNVIGSLSQLVTALQSGTSSDVATATDAVTNAIHYVSAQHSLFGNSINQINSQDAFLGQEKITLSSEANNLVGIDTATAAENLAQAEAHNSAVLAAAAKVLPTSLLDYLK